MQTFSLSPFCSLSNSLTLHRAQSLLFDLSFYLSQTQTNTHSYKLSIYIFSHTRACRTHTHTHSHTHISRFLLFPRITFFISSTDYEICFKNIFERLTFKYFQFDLNKKITSTEFQQKYQICFVKFYSRNSLVGKKTFPPNVFELRWKQFSFFISLKSNKGKVILSKFEEWRSLLYFRLFLLIEYLFFYEMKKKLAFLQISQNWRWVRCGYVDFKKSKGYKEWMKKLWSHFSWSYLTPKSTRMGFERRPGI